MFERTARLFTCSKRMTKNEISSDGVAARRHVGLKRLLTLWASGMLKTIEKCMSLLPNAILFDSVDDCWNRGIAWASWRLAENEYRTCPQTKYLAVVRCIIRNSDSCRSCTIKLKLNRSRSLQNITKHSTYLLPSHHLFHLSQFMVFVYTVARRPVCKRLVTQCAASSVYCTAFVLATSTPTISTANVRHAVRCVGFWIGTHKRFRIQTHTDTRARTHTQPHNVCGMALNSRVCVLVCEERRENQLSTNDDARIKIGKCSPLHGRRRRWRKIIYKSARHSIICNICYSTVERDANKFRVSEWIWILFSTTDDYSPCAPPDIRKISTWKSAFEFVVPVISVKRNIRDNSPILGEGQSA